MSIAQAEQPLLSVRRLSVAFLNRREEKRPVREVSFDIHRGQRVGIVGESGSGKSLTALAIMRLLKPPGRIVRGEIVLDGRNLLTYNAREIADVRGRQVSMIYQNPLSSLNPVQTIGHQLVEAIRLHREVSKRVARDRAIELLEEVGLPEPARRFRSYPHQLSGGMLQRAVIAMALSCDPGLVIADEPTTALDVTTQARIMELLIKLVERRNTAIIFITHDLGVAAALCNEILVMYAGRIVEQAPAGSLYSRPIHPYSEALLGATCRLTATPGARLPTILGNPPVPGAYPQGCAFHSRCAMARDICHQEAPPIVSTDEHDAFVECHIARERLAGDVGSGTGEGDT